MDMFWQPLASIMNNDHEQRSWTTFCLILVQLYQYQTRAYIHLLGKGLFTSFKSKNSRNENLYFFNVTTWFLETFCNEYQLVIYGEQPPGNIFIYFPAKTTLSAHYKLIMLALQYTPLGLKRQNVISSHDQENQLYNPTLFFDVLKVCFFS